MLCDGCLLAFPLKSGLVLIALSQSVHTFPSSAFRRCGASLDTQVAYAYSTRIVFYHVQADRHPTVFGAGLFSLQSVGTASPQLLISDIVQSDPLTSTYCRLFPLHRCSLPKPQTSLGQYIAADNLFAPLHNTQALCCWLLATTPLIACSSTASFFSNITNLHQLLQLAASRVCLRR